MKNYKNLGNTIEVAVNKDFVIRATYTFKDFDKNLFLVKLGLFETDSAFGGDIDDRRNFEISGGSSAKETRDKVAETVTEMIHNGAFTASIEELAYILDCIDAKIQADEKGLGE